MYAEHFGLHELPFCNTPDPRYFFATPDHEEALASLVYAVQERKGFVLLTGEIGAGKTLVSRMMLRHFEERIASAVIHHAICDATELMHAIAAELELPAGGASSPAAIVRRLHDYLLEQYATDRPVVLVLDEAQNLPQAAFEQLRMIGNLEADQAKLLQICFVGQPELQQTIRSPELRQLRQRIFRSFHLPPLSRELTESYIAHRLKVAGAETQAIFDMGALDRIFAHSRGIPRVINTLCDNAMLSAYSSGRAAVDAILIDSVIGFETPKFSARDEREAVGHSARKSRKNTPVGSSNTPHADDRSEIREMQGVLSELRRSFACIQGQFASVLTTTNREAALGGTLASRVSHAEHALRRIDRACEAVGATEARIRRLSREVEGVAALLAPLARQLEGAQAHTSAQTVCAESAAARLENLIRRAARMPAGDAFADSALESKAGDNQLVRQKDAARNHVFANIADAVSNLRRAARQVSAS